MEAIANNIKKKLSPDNLVEMMKDANVIDNERVKEEDVRKTLETINIDHYVHAEELAEKLNKITEEAAAEQDESVKIVEKRSFFSVQGQSTKDPLSRTKRTDEDYMIKDNITGFLD